MMNDAWQTAVHEAGHAVIARVLDHTVGAVTIVPDFELLEEGCVIVSNPDATQWQWEQKGKFREYDVLLRARALIKMAGAEAEVEFFGLCGGGDGDDRDDVADALSRVGVAGPDSDAIYARYEPRLRSWTRTLVRRHRATIEHVAKALMERKTLRGDEIDALVGA